MSRLAGKVAVVTGAAQGIGRGIAEVFSEEGAAVAIVDSNAETGMATLEELLVDGGRALFAAADVSDEMQVADAVELIVGELGRIDVLVNCAALFTLKGIDASPEEWQRMMAVNIMGPALMAKHVVPHIQVAGGGSIVNISSVSGFVAQKGFLTYSATKAAVAAMTRCMALDLVDCNIRVNAVCPGATWTPQVQRTVAEMSMTREEACREPNLGAEQMMKRIAEPREIAHAVLFLASDDASFITGANVMVDGGWTAL